MSERAPGTDEPLAILAGCGTFPMLVGRAVSAGGRRVLFIGIEGEADPAIEAFQHIWLRRGQLGRLFRVLRSNAIRDLVMIGGIRQRRLPRWNEVDLGGLISVLRHIGMLWRGDDSVLRIIARLIEAHGFRVIGAHDVAPELVVSAGCPTRRKPDIGDWTDILVGFEAAKAHGARDRGQAVIASGGLVLMRETPEGTDAMLLEIAGDRQVDGLLSQAGVLVKCLKPGQDPRFDMPAIGPETVARAEAAGLKGIAVDAGFTLIADFAGVIADLDRRGMFLFGLTDQDVDDARRLTASPSIGSRS